MRAGSGLAPPPPVAPSTEHAQVVQVLETAAQRVAEVTQEQVIHSARHHQAPAPELENLAKQQHVLKMTAQAYDQVASHGHVTQPTPIVAVADAARQMVFQAAQVAGVQKQAAVDDQKISGALPYDAVSAPVTVNEVSVTAQEAVAQAVEITGPLSSEVHVLMTARSLLQQQEHALGATGTTPPAERSQSAGSTPPAGIPVVSFPPLSNVPLADYALS
jgi:hypothetical protein